MKLYDCATAPSPRRVRIFVAEKNLQIPVEQVDLANRQQHSDAFAEINPHRTVPVLELDDGSRLTSTHGIQHYLELICPQPPLIGRDAAERGKVIDLDSRIEQEGFMAVGEAFRNRSKAFANNVFTGKHPHEQIPALVDRGHKRTQEFFDWLDDHLQHHQFVAGDCFSIADITAVVTLDFARWIKRQPGTAHTHLLRWYADVSDRPSVKNSIA